MSNDTAAGSIGYRYRLLRTAQSILAKSGATWKEQHRTCWCSRSLLFSDYGEGNGGRVDFYRNESRTNATMRGLQRCGNLHACPICAAKVGELRRKQLSAGMERHISNGQTAEQKKKQLPGSNSAYLITQTFSHDRCNHGEGEKCDNCLDVLHERFSKARAKFQNSREWKRFREQQNVIGCVNSFEHTVSIENGWHPHVHMLVFCNAKAFDEGAAAENGDLTSPAIEKLNALWCKCLLDCKLGDKSKLNDMKKHAFNVRGGEKAAQYIAKYGHDEKWGASREMTQSHSKVGSAGTRDGHMHFTPFQLLIWADAGDAWAVHRFRDYAKAIEGKRALTWTPSTTKDGVKIPGLKEALDVQDVDEEQWAKNDENQPEQVYVGYLVAEQYAAIMKRKQLPEFLQYVATCAGSQDDLNDYIECLHDMPSIASGALLIKRKEGRVVAFTT